MKDNFKCYGHQDTSRISLLFCSPLIVITLLFFVVSGFNVDVLSPSVIMGIFVTVFFGFPLGLLFGKHCDVEKPLSEHSDEEINLDLEIGEMRAYREKINNEASKRANEIRKQFGEKLK